MFDFHTHSKNSPDSRQPLDELCSFAIEKGLEGIAVTDHVDMWFYAKENAEGRITQCIREVKAAREKYDGRLKIYQGVEMAEYLYDTDNADIIMGLADYDVILGSVHSVLYEDFTDSYSRLDFSTKKTPEDKLKGFIREYFGKVLEMAENTDFDVLSHLICPLRYINGRYKRGISADLFKNEVDFILEAIIRRSIALEINTSGINTPFNSLMPDEEIIRRYYKMGGRLITVGSDAHIPQNLANGFDYAVNVLKKIGFCEYYIYEKRVPVPLALK